MRVVQLGDRLQVHYAKRFEGGALVTSRGKAPIELTVGVDSRRLPGLGLEMVGLAVGESRVVLVPAQRAFGLHDPGRTYRLARTRFAGHTNLCVGKWVRVEDRRHRPRLVRIVELHENMVVIDANHPRAGQSLELEVEVIAIRGAEATPAANTDTEGRTATPEGALRVARWRDDGGKN